MSDLQKIGAQALASAPQPLRRALDGLGVQFRGENGPVSAAAGDNGRPIAGVTQGNPNTISVVDPQTFQRSPAQLATHEATHLWQNNLPPSIQKAIPPDNPNDPYNYGGTQGIKTLLSQGKGLANMPREQAAAAMQYGLVNGMPEPYNRLAHTMDSVPLSQIDMTAPQAKLINTHPRTPQVPPASVPGMNFATQTYQPGHPAPGDDPYASIAKPIQVQTGTVGGHAPDQPPAGYAQGVSAPPADDPYASIATTPTAPKEEPYSTQLLKSIPGAAKSVGKGLLEGAGSDLANITGSQKLKSLTTPSGDENDIAGQQFGKGVEQGAEFLIPGLGEEKAASLLPDVKYARPLARIGYNALTSGAINKAQGGDFSTGAAAGGGAGLLGEGMRAAAPTLAEKAIGIRGKFDRSFNKEPGRALLDETTGISPEGVARQAKSRVNTLAGQNETVAAGIQTPVPLTPARQALDDASQKAITQNAKGTHQQLQAMGDTLHTNFHTGQPIPADVPASDALRLRQGFDQEHLGWNPDLKDPVMGAGRRAYGQLTGAIHNVSPEIASNDARISSLLPVAKRAQATALNDNTGAKILGRFGAHTGALTGAALGATGGYQHGGVEGAVLGGLGGAVLPELIASPQAQLAGARLFNKPGLLTRPLTGAVLNVPRSMSEEEQR